MKTAYEVMKSYGPGTSIPYDHVFIIWEEYQDTIQQLRKACKRTERENEPGHTWAVASDLVDDFYSNQNSHSDETAK